MVRVGDVMMQRVQDRRQVVGRLVEVRRSQVAAQREGRIIEINVDEGDAVTGGKTVLARTDDVWAKLDVRVAEAALQRANAEVEASQANLDLAQRHHKFLMLLDATNAAKKKEVDDARDQVRLAKAAISNARAILLDAQALLERRREELARHTIVAPFDGVVVSKMTEVGQWVAPGDAIAQIISVGTIEVEVAVPESLINHLAVGAPVQLKVTPLSLQVSAKVTAVVPEGANAARTFPVKLRLDDRDGALKAGMSVAAYVPTGQEVDTLTVPRDAVQYLPTGTQVWCNFDGKAMPVGVKVLFGVDDRYAVRPTGGGPPLRPGMQVVVEGAEQLFPTRPLIIDGAAAKTAAVAKP